MEIVEEESAVVDYQDIIDAAEEEPETDSIETFSGDYDGHTTEDAPRYVDYDVHERNDVVSSRSGPLLIVLDSQAEKCLRDEFQWYREHGASRQVAAEKVAEHRRNTIERLRRYYAEDWNYIYVMIQFRDYTASLGGINSDAGDYLDDVKAELADEIVGELERDGYTVINKPEDKPTKRVRRSQLNSFNTSGR